MFYTWDFTVILQHSTLLIGKNNAKVASTSTGRKERGQKKVFLFLFL